MNYQKQDHKCFLNDAKFSQNGGCGYVLKPEFLSSPNPNYSPIEIPNNISLGPKLMSLTIISGQHIPRKSSGGFAGPYVKARIIGHSDEQDTKHVTESVKKNGFNPFWNETFQFYIKAPALAFLELTVRDKQNYTIKLREKVAKDPTLGGYICPINLLRQGRQSYTLKMNYF